MRSRAFLSLYFAVFVAVMGISMVSPLLPVYAKEMGASGVWLGLTFSAFAITQAIFGPFAGRLSDRYGRKPFIVAGLLVYLIAAIGYLTAQSFYQVIAFRAFSGIGTSLIFSVTRAYIGDMTPPGQEGRWLGTFATGDIIGFGTGPLVAGLLREVFGFRSVFVAMALLLASSAVIILWWLPGRPPVSQERRARNLVAPRLSFKAALTTPIVLAVTVFMLVTSLSSGAAMSFLGLHLENNIGVGPILVGVAFATQDLAAGFAQPLFGRMADRYNRRLLVVIGLSMSAVFIAFMGLANSYLLIVLLLFLMGAGGAISQVSAGAIQVVAGRKVGMGTVIGLGSAGNGVGIVIGSVIGGLLLDQFSISAPFLFGGVMTAIGMILFVVLTRGVEMAEVPETHVRGELSPEASAAGGS